MEGSPHTCSRATIHLSVTGTSGYPSHNNWRHFYPNADACTSFMIKTLLVYGYSQKSTDHRCTIIRLSCAPNALVYAGESSVLEVDVSIFRYMYLNDARNHNDCKQPSKRASCDNYSMIINVRRCSIIACDGTCIVSTLQTVSFNSGTPILLVSMAHIFLLGATKTPWAQRD